MDELEATHTCLSQARERVAVCKNEAPTPPSAGQCGCNKVEPPADATVLVPTQKMGMWSTTVACQPMKVPIFHVLQAPGGQVTLTDGRTLTASIHSVAGCQAWTDPGVTGTSVGNWTRLAQAPSNPSCTLARTSSTAMYRSFRAIRLKVTGGTLATASFTFEDIDAEAKLSSESADGWRETMTAVGQLNGRVVLPRLSVPRGGHTRVYPYQMCGESLQAVGWGTHSNFPVNGVSYGSWRQILNIETLYAYVARGEAVFDSPLDDLLIVYALTQASKVTDSKTSAFVSAVSVGC